MIAQRLASISRSNLWGFIDHFVVSASNFVFVVVIARIIDETAFGLFVLFYSAMQLAAAIQAALITQPYVVHGASLTGPSALRFRSAQVRLQLLLIAALVVPVAAAGLGIEAIAGARGALLPAACLAFAMAVAQLQEFVRRVLYVERRFLAATVNDIVSYAPQALVAIGLVGSITSTLSLPLVALAATSIAGVLVGIAQVPGLLRVAEADSIADVRARNWNFGKWLLASVATAWASTDGYLFLLAQLLGPIAAGTFKAADMLLRPANVATFAMENVAIVSLSRTAVESGAHAIRLGMATIIRLGLPLIVAYVVSIAAISPLLNRLLYADQFRWPDLLMPLLGAYYIVRYGAQVFSVGLRALRATPPLFVGSLLAAIFALAVGPAMVMAAGVEGAAAGLLVSAIIATVVRLVAVRRAPLVMEPVARLR